jgi:prepilin-type N-terminal cleavage/methylation domain-containing protein
MKQIFKSKKRKGFTLVETILAVFILVVISTMLINGFITTMGYSYQTAIYSKSAAMNYSLCMQETGKWNKKSNYLDGGREAAIKNGAGNYTTATLNFIPGPLYTSCESLNVAIDKKTTLEGVVPGSLPYMDPRFAPTDSGNTSYVDNRTTFYYYPEYCCDNSDGHVGQVIVMLDATDENNIHYYWLVVDKTNNANAYAIDSKTGKIVVNSSYNLNKVNTASNRLGEINLPKSTNTISANTIGGGNTI